jgi:flagellar hook-length control protein FliK
MSMSALAARVPSAVAAANAATAPHGTAAGAGSQGEGDNVFAALLAGLGEPAQAATVAGDATALTAAVTQDAAPLAGDPALPGALPDPMAGMALLMAQYTPGAAPVVASGATPGAPALPQSASPASHAPLPAAFPASAGADLGAAPAIALATPTSMQAQPVADVPSTAMFLLADPTEPSTSARQTALAADAVPMQAAADTPSLLQAVPDIASLAAGWAAAPLPAAAQGPAAAAPVYQAELPSRPGDAGFAGDLAAQVTVLVEGGFQQAQLRLNPAELGPIQIQLSVSAQTNTADISFSAVHGFTRESIEQALPELREMLQAQGLSLGQTGVSGGQQQPGDGRDSAPAHARAARPGAAAGTDGAGVDAGLQGLGLAAAPRATRGMLDLYA